VDDFMSHSYLLPSFCHRLFSYCKKTIPAVVGIMTDDSKGSGFFIRDDGYILTNTHLLENANTIEVMTSDQHIIPAKVIQLDSKTDLAVIKVEGSGFPYLTFGDPDQMEIGDLVLSIGYPDF
jgi:S1-C subfamily serine protease